MKKLLLIVYYVRYLLKSKNRHGLQSSFVYNLNEAVFRFDKKEKEQSAIEELHSTLLNNQRVINVRDFGAGFGGKMHRALSIRFITKNSSKPPKYARLLFRLVKYFHPQTMLELGTSVGISALYQTAGNPLGKLITLEGCPETARVAREGFKKFPQNKIQLAEGEFMQSLPEVLKSIDKLDYVFIDGHHQLQPTLHYFEMCLAKMHEGSVVVIDDINWSQEMREAWKCIQKHPRVSITIDLFMMGIAFVNPGFSKEHFVIRY